MGLFSGLFFGCGCGPCPPRPDKVIGPLPDGGTDDDGISDKTEEFGHLIQEQKSEDRRKEHLHIVKDGDLLGAWRYAAVMQTCPPVAAAPASSSQHSCMGVIGS